ncbi:Uncharacterised protein [Vibrio cholerae]|nr:Uncharacterised protein [Vibrio cholerae]
MSNRSTNKNANTTEIMPISKTAEKSSCMKVGAILGGVDIMPPHCTSPNTRPRAVTAKIAIITAPLTPR